MKPLKVCIFTETYYPVIGGGETQAQLLAEGLVSHGHSAIILTRRSDKSLKKHEQIGPIPVHRIPPSGGGQFKKWGLIFSALPALIKLKNHYDLIFVSGFRIIGISAVLLSKLLAKKCVLKADSQGEMSGDFFNNGLKKLGLSRKFLPFRIFLYLRNAVLKRANAFSVITEDIAAELNALNIPSNKLWNIPNSVDTHRFYPVDNANKSVLRQKLGLPAYSSIVIYSGRLVSYKGLPLLLEVWSEIHKNYPDAHLLLVGAGGLDIHNCERELLAYVKSNGLEEVVHFTGNVYNVPDYLQAADIYAFPTKDDAFPSSLIEAMTCKLAVVTTPVGAIKTIIQDRQNGLMVQPGDFTQLYQALETLLSDKHFASHLGQAAHKTVQENYSTEIITDRYLDLFKNVMG
jgi:glycosyltransferase involved in cell wall biosynthesis